MTARWLSLLIPLTAMIGCGVAAGDDSATSLADLGVLLPGIDEASLDRTTDPCQDFYQFACGGYLASPPDPQVTNPTASYGRRAFIELRTQLNDVFDRFLAEPPTSAAQAKVHAFYRSHERGDLLAHRGGARTERGNIGELAAEGNERRSHS